MPYVYHPSDASPLSIEGAMYAAFQKIMTAEDRAYRTLDSTQEADFRLLRAVTIARSAVCDALRAMDDHEHGRYIGFAMYEPDPCDSQPRDE